MTYSISTDRLNFTGEYRSIKQAINAAASELALSPRQKFYVGQNIHLGYGEQFYPDADSILDIIGESAYEVSERAEDWLTNIPQKEKEDLKSMLDKTIIKWMKKYHQEATFWIVEEIKEYIIEENTVDESTLT